MQKRSNGSAAGPPIPVKVVIAGGFGVEVYSRMVIRAA
jgi:hypothetical protein